MLNKSIEHGKEKRKEYKGAKAVSRRCRNHGDCSYCRKNEQFKKKLGKGKPA